LDLLQPAKYLIVNSDDSLARIDSPEEFFPIHLIEFAHYVLDRVFQSWDNNVFDGIDTPIRRPYNLVKNGESCLKGRQFDQCLNRLGIDLLCA
jgi:hypothetical protein